MLGAGAGVVVSGIIGWLGAGHRGGAALGWGLEQGTPPL
jgi:hypothetical protein